MLIKSALAAAEKAVSASSTVPDTTTSMAGAAGGISQTILFTVVLVGLFYFLLIRPQQKRYKDHANMLGKLGVKDKIVTQGGMIGTIESFPSDKEAVIDFGNGTKMTVLRSSIMSKYDASDLLKKKA